MNLCIDCKHYRRGQCSRDGYIIATNLVTGKREVHYRDRHCLGERGGFGHINKTLNQDRCGEDGKYFEPRPEPKTWLGRVLSSVGRRMMATSANVRPGPY